jgi:uncharacterized protein (DUF3820 family)
MLMPWGIFRGIDVNLLPSPYMRWILREGKWLKLPLRQAMEKELEARGSEESLVGED